ncbi:MAG: rod shape-determining protein RodA [Synergistaceae bacterium]|jgi:rod shape determining protein RodA|nr:rod shape-determining protein RodA [Synergistaceae bacterium]
MDTLRFSVLKEDLAALDKLLFGSVVLLIFWGIACIFSAGSGSAGRGGEYAIRQLSWGVFSCMAYVLVVGIGYRQFMDWAYPIYGVTLLLLFATMLAAPRVKGAQSWFSLGFIRFQPSEFAKISLTLVLAKFLSRYPPLSPKPFLGGLGVGMPALLLVLAQPDLGSALVYIVIIFSALFVAGTPFKYLGSILGLGASLLPFGWFYLKEFQKMRLLVFLDPTRDPLGAGYNAIQSRIAVGSGSVWGKGFLQGLQSKLRFLPEPHTDFIFSVYAEEFGFWGSSLLLFVFGIIFTRIVAAGMKSRDIQGKLIVAGVTAWIWFQMFESIGMSIGLMPITGLPLPFLSYGGSSLLSIAIALGLTGSVYAGAAKRYK